MREELGYADAVIVDELGDTSVVIFRIDGSESRIATIVIRGSTDNYMDDIERAIDDGVNTFKGITKVSLIYICSVMQLLWSYRFSSIFWLYWKIVRCVKKSYILCKIVVTYVNTYSWILNYCTIQSAVLHRVRIFVYIYCYLKVTNRPRPLYIARV